MGYADEIMGNVYRVQIRVHIGDDSSSRSFLRELRTIDTLEGIYRRYGSGFVELQVPVDLLDQVEQSAVDNGLNVYYY